MQHPAILMLTKILLAGAYLGFIKGGTTSRSNLLGGRGMQSTLPSMQSMLELGGSGGMPPQEILNNSC